MSSRSEPTLAATALATGRHQQHGPGGQYLVMCAGKRVRSAGGLSSAADVDSADDFSVSPSRRICTRHTVPMLDEHELASIQRSLQAVDADSSDVLAELRRHEAIRAALDRALTETTIGVMRAMAVHIRTDVHRVDTRTNRGVDELAHGINAWAERIASRNRPPRSAFYEPPVFIEEDLDG